MNKDDLEQMVDQLGLYGVLDALQEIAYEKAEHVESTWQDANLAKAWRDSAGLILSIEFRIDKLLS